MRAGTRTEVGLGTGASRPGVSSAVLTLTVMQGPDRGRKFELPAHEPQLIGRSSEALPLTDKTISRRHAELTPDDGTWWVRDLNSQNGTYVNGIRLTARTQLQQGDQVRTGATLFLFGRAETQAESVRLMDPSEMDAAVEKTLASNEDSVVMVSPVPGAAAQDHLRIIYKLTTLIAQAPETGLGEQELLAAVLELVFSVFKPERGFIVLGDGGYESEPRPVVVKHRTPPKDKAPIHVSKTILQHVLRRAEGVLSTNAMGDPRFAAGDSVQRLHIHSALCSPIRHRERTYGAIYIDSTMANHTFTHAQLALMNAIGQHTGLALANAELYRAKVQSERLAAIGETVASLSHSIKNILQGLRGGADLVEMGIRKEDFGVSQGGWDILKRNLDRIVGLTTNMLAFGRQGEIEIELTPIGPIVEDCAKLLEDQCRANSIALKLDLDAEMPPIPIDPDQMHQALMNLMLNAVQAVGAGTVGTAGTAEEGGAARNGGGNGGENGAVTVRTTFHAAGSRGEHSLPVAEINIIDNGPGIGPDRIERIFEPFHTTKGTRGTGLGLAVTRRIVEEHRGQLRVESDEGIGSVFQIVLSTDASGHIDPAATAAAGEGAHDAGVDVFGDDF
jgi:two-component system, NtrC family, sensor kinase